MTQVFSGRWPKSHQGCRTTGWWLIHIEFDAISSPACSKQVDMAGGTRSGVFDAFLGTPESHRPYANVLDQHTARSCNREAGDTDAAIP
jgi:hypothetical protein